MTITFAACTLSPDETSVEQDRDVRLLDLHRERLQNTLVRFLLDTGHVRPYLEIKMTNSIYTAKSNDGRTVESRSLQGAVQSLASLLGLPQQWMYTTCTDPMAVNPCTWSVISIGAGQVGTVTSTGDEVAS